MEFIALIPARYCSTRFPGKPLALIDGKPMIQRVFERASTVFPECYVATDDERIAEVVRGFGGSCVMTGDHHRSGTDRCAEALEAVENKTGHKYDVAVNIQGDEPFVETAHLEALKSLFTDNGTEIGTLVRRFSAGEDVTDPNSPKVVISAQGYALYFSRLPVPYVRDEKTAMEVTYYKHLGLYAYRTDILRRITLLPAGILETAESLEQLRWLENGYRIKTARVGGETLAVDTPGDLARINELIAAGKL